MRTIGKTGLVIPPLGFGAFKIGRNQGIKYPKAYELPDQDTVDCLLNSVLDLGCSLIDTAPAYGLSEIRIGKAIGHRRDEFVLSTKVGETFADGKTTFDFSPEGIRTSLERSLRNLKTEVLDIVFVHSSGEDRQIMDETETVSILQEFRSRGLIRAIGLSGKTTDGAMQALKWADVLMVEYHLQDLSHKLVIEKAQQDGIGIFVKKGLASGQLPAVDSIRFVLANPGVTSLVVGSLNFDHFRENWSTALRTVNENPLSN